MGTIVTKKTSIPLVWPGLGALLIVLLSLLAYIDFWGVKQSVTNHPVRTLVIIGLIEFCLMGCGICHSRNVLLKIAQEEFEHDNFEEPKWLRNREIFQPVIGGKIKHSESVKKLKDANFSGIEGGASFSSVISLLHLLAAGLFTTVAYFVIGTILNLTDNRGGFLFENNEGFTAVLALFVILTSTTVIPVYTDLAENVSKQQEIFKTQISGVSRNLLLIDRKMDPVWLHYQNIMNRIIPEWESQIKDHYSNLGQHLKRKQKIMEFVYKSEYVKDFERAAFIQHLSKIDLEESNPESPNEKKITLTKENWSDIKDRLNDWILNDKISEKSKLFRDGNLLDGRRRSVTIDRVLQDRFFPSEESEVLYLIKKILKITKSDKSSPSDITEPKLGKFVEMLLEIKKQSLSAYQHHLENVAKLVPAISERCLDCGISVDSFLDDYHLFSHTSEQLKGVEDDSFEGDEPKNKSLAVMAQQLYFGIYFFICQDSGENVFISPQQFKIEIDDGVDFFRNLFSSVCELMRNGSLSNLDADKTEQLEDQKNSFEGREQLFLELNYQRSALHNWVRASQSACRRRRWMELEKNEASKKRTTFYGIPVLPVRQARLDDMVRHAGLPTSDMKRLRFKSLIDILPVSNAFSGSYENLLEKVITKMGGAKPDRPIGT